MNVERFVGVCREFSGRMEESWGKLTGDPLHAAAGRRAQAAGRARQRSGIEKERAEREMSDFLTRNRDWYF